MNLANLNYLVTFALASFVVGSGFCRIVLIRMELAQYRFVAPSVLFFFWGAAVFVSLIAGEKIDWYQPIGLLGISLYFWISKGAWSEGMPDHYRRDLRLQDAVSRVVAVRKLTLENISVGAVVAVSIGAAGVGASEGRGDPLQFYSAHAEPPVANAGKTINIVQTFRRVRSCPGYVTRFVVDANTGVAAQHFEQTPTGAAPVGKKMVDVPTTLMLSPNLKPGRYFYKAIVYSACEDANYTKEIGPVPFVIAPTDLPN